MLKHKIKSSEKILVHENLQFFQLKKNGLVITAVMTMEPNMLQDLTDTEEIIELNKVESRYITYSWWVCVSLDIGWFFVFILRWIVNKAWWRSELYTTFGMNGTFCTRKENVSNVNDNWEEAEQYGIVDGAKVRMLEFSYCKCMKSNFVLWAVTLGLTKLLIFITVAQTINYKSEKKDVQKWYRWRGKLFCRKLCAQQDESIKMMHYFFLLALCANDRIYLVDLFY